MAIPLHSVPANIASIELTDQMVFLDENISDFSSPGLE